ncbi:MAG: prepilin-type N-terminal cleavage/methylation domain-containing protein [Myxococcales bacterium]|nr:prepilin-type N-terminal cleavage/methylation domain-containing protein [Myxococcales bacterium]
MSHFLPSLTRRGFSLLEVMIALAILTTSIVILVETQSTAAWATREAEKVVTGTDLARYKMSEALLRVEADGFTDGEIFESGDFRDLGDEVLNLQMGEALEDFHWEYAVQEIDIQLAGDIAAMASEFAGDDGGGEGGPAIPGLPGGAGGLSALLSPEMLSQMLGPYIREVRVRVWWGKNSDEAEEYGSEVILVSHVINPSGDLVNLGGGLGL